MTDNTKHLTVGNLIKRLQEFPEDLPVVWRAEEDGLYWRMDDDGSNFHRWNIAPHNEPMYGDYVQDDDCDEDDAFPAIVIDF